MSLLQHGTKVTSTWSPDVKGTIVGYGSLLMAGELHPVYLVDIGRNRMFDIDREPPGPVAARILSLRCDHVIELGIYRIEGHGIPGDIAYVEAPSAQQALQLLTEELDEQRIDYTTPRTWIAERVERPMKIVIFWRG